MSQLNPCCGIASSAPGNRIGDRPQAQANIRSKVKAPRLKAWLRTQPGPPANWSSTNGRLES